ncbi:hypothetical protein B0T24DRAFT_703535 [Lasiosphaeria ovina]|uniref:Dyp-type peroxidase n=1 Tax=Lasiosphaeria ovina TaxID=92902 RepID=A0AAE0KBU6_9PEZI|nr:hypothetical protein B0T24DRAFT_703535 [Lasiosphaeria ovina]
MPPDVPPTIPPSIPPITSPTAPSKYQWKYPALTPNQLDVIQGDIWSKGFPKHNETYYLFKIAPGSATAFAQCLRKMVVDQPELISNLKSTKKARDDIAAKKQRAEAASKLGQPNGKPEKLHMSFALIAFTYKGLNMLNEVRKTDPAFSNGMKSDGDALNDPITGLDPLLANADEIHGLIKVAGCSNGSVNGRLGKIQAALQRGTVIQDVPGGTEGRLDGATREKPFRGKEHFGFEDGISQPLMNGIDDTPPSPDSEAHALYNMDTEQSILIVTGTTRHENSSARRPDWMHDGSFLVFRKLEQDVKAFRQLTASFATYQCESAAHMGAKLMGRWPSGAPLALQAYNTTDAPPADHGKVKVMNNFGYPTDGGDKEPACPFAAHIRKTNPRRFGDWGLNSGDQGLKFAKMIRSGISYGPDYADSEPAGLQRGLLFACYQAFIEDGFQHMQASWSNKTYFPKSDSGLDPIIGQVPEGEVLKTVITNRTAHIEVPITTPLVTFRGGEYFFVPSIAALKGALTEAPSVS